MISRTFTRFVAGALFLILVAVIAGFAHLRPAAIIVVMLLAWVVVTALEWAASRSAGRAPATAEKSVRMSEAPRRPEMPPPPVVAAAGDNPFAALAASLDEEQLEWEEPPLEPPVDPEPPPAPAPEEPAAAEVEPRPARRLWSRAGRGREARPDRPARERSVRREPAGRPREEGNDREIEPRPCVTCGKPISRERLKALPDAVQCIDCKRAGRPVPGEEPAAAVASEPPVEREPAVPVASQPEPEPVPAPVLAAVPAPEPEPSPPVAREEHPVVRLPVRAEPREWNLWELERRVRERAGRSAARDEEWAFLLVYLREFASPDGRLPADFDDLVRESFSELIGQ